MLRPVHAQMLCEIASDPDASLDKVDIFALYDRFIHYLIDREVQKPGRYKRFDIPLRRRFNAAVALWLWERGEASTTTLADVPTAICKRIVAGVSHDLDDAALARELTAGCLVHKAGSTVYFGHRSIQEFLVAEYLFESDLLARSDGRPDLTRVASLLSREVGDFVLDRLRRQADRIAIARGWLEQLEFWQGADYVSQVTIHFLAQLTAIAEFSVAELWRSPWHVFLAYFAANKSTDFAATAGELNFAVDLLKQIDSKNSRAFGTVLYLLARIFHLTHPTPLPAGAEYLARLIQPSAISAAIKQASKGTTSLAIIKRTDELALWTLLSAVTISRDGSGSRELHLTLDIQDLCLALAPIVGTSLTTQSLPAGSELSVPLQLVLKATGLSNKQLDTIRPFFNDDALRSRIRPLTVDRRSRPAPSDKRAPGQ